MKKNLSLRETIVITSMLFGMFFGAGNLIFPAKLGIDAGRSMWLAYGGLVITAVGLPLLAVAALGISRSDGLLDLSGRVGRKYGLFFTTLLYLTIGPLFAIPRCASTSFAVGATSLIPEKYYTGAQFVFTLLFFAAVLAFSLKPGKIMTWIGKILNPIFLLFMAILVIAVLLHPINTISEMQPTENYASGSAAFFSGFLEGYNTLDALAGLAFGIVVVDVVRRNGIREPARIAANTVRAGIFSCLSMGVIYFFVMLIAVRCGSLCQDCADGSAVLATIANTYFHAAGAVLLLAIVTFACLKTAVALVTSCGEAFVGMFPHGPSYRAWAVIFCLAAFGIANFGLATIVNLCVPVLMFLYPLAITLIVLALLERFFSYGQTVYRWTTLLTMAAALLDFINSLASVLGSMLQRDTPILNQIVDTVSEFLPLFRYGLGWICPAIAGFVIGLGLEHMKKHRPMPS
jgi:LIVCS family branched-chain amino acid:cation transporter